MDLGYYDSLFQNAYDESDRTHQDLSHGAS